MRTRNACACLRHLHMLLSDLKVLIFHMPHTLARVLGKRAILGAMATAACALAVSACGGEEEEGTIPQDQAAQIEALLNQLEQRLDEGNCKGAEDTALEITIRVEALPDQVDGELRQTLVAASSNLVDQSRTQCEEAEEPPPVDDGATGETGSVEGSEG